MVEKARDQTPPLPSLWTHQNVGAPTSQAAVRPLPLRVATGVAAAPDAASMARAVAVPRPRPQQRRDRPGGGGGPQARPAGVDHPAPGDGPRSVREGAVLEGTGMGREPGTGRTGTSFVRCSLLSRCDLPSELFSIITKAAFVDLWPGVRAYWVKRSRRSDSRDWWETLYEQLSETAQSTPRRVRGAAPAFLRRFGDMIREERIAKGLSQRQLALRVSMK